MWVTAQDGIEIFNSTKIRADGNILYRTFMLINGLCLVPGTSVLLPLDLVARGGQI
jgi:hypothetical protein